MKDPCSNAGRRMRGDARYCAVVMDGGGRGSEDARECSSRKEGFMQLLDLLSHPGREFTAIPFWFLNGDLTDAEIRRQLADFAAHGVYGVVLHPRMGLAKRIAYLGNTYFHYIRTAVRAAADLDMRVVLYDDGMYPSGSAGGQVVEGHPELASEGLALTEKVLPGDELLAQTKSGALVVRRSGGTMRGLHWGEDDGEPGAPPTADILNPAAVARFIELTHEAYYRELKEYFGNTVIGMFTDEPSILGRNVEGMFPWTRGFAGLFTAAGGNPAGLAALFRQEENADTRLYHRLILEREGEVYYGTLSRWCTDHGIGLMGHPHQSDDIEVERYFAVPGQDLVLRWLGPEKDGLAGADSAMGKCSADAARLRNRRRNSSECFGACGREENPWQFSGGDMKWYTDWLAVRGVNLFIPHAFYYSIAGKRREERPPDVGPHSIWWPHYEKWASYWARLSALMTDIDLYAGVAVPCRNRDLRPEAVRTLYEHQTGFQYLPESVWKDCEERDGALYCRGRRYEAVLGEEDWFPGVPRYAAERTEPDCRCAPAQPQLRCARFTKNGTECWLLVNEGEEPIRTVLTLPTQGPVGAYDLWNAAAVQQPARRVQEGRLLELQLPVRGSLLLFACTPAEYARLPEPAAACALPAPSFSLAETDSADARKIFRARLAVSAAELAHPSVSLTVDAEEMAELYVNGEFAGAGFWPPQTFELRSLLREGTNELILVVTGSMANRYGIHPVWYGLRQENGGNSEESGEDRAEHGGENAGNGDGESAHRALHLAHFQGTAGSDGV